MSGERWAVPVPGACQRSSRKTYRRRRSCSPSMTGGKRGQVPDQPLHLVPGPCTLEAGGNDRNRAGWLLGGAGAGRTLRGSVAVWIPLVLIRHPDVIVAACGNTKKPGGRRRKRISQSSGLTDSILSFCPECTLTSRAATRSWTPSIFRGPTVSARYMPLGGSGSRFVRLAVEPSKPVKVEVHSEERDDT